MQKIMLTYADVKFIYDKKRHPPAEPRAPPISDVLSTTNMKQNSGGTAPKHYAERVARRNHQNGSMFSLKFAKLCDAKRFGQTASRTCALQLKCNISPKSAEAGIPVLKTPSRTNINPKHMENVMK